MYTSALTGVNDALEISQVSAIPQPDRAAYEKIAGNVLEAFSPGEKPLPQQYMSFLDPFGDWLGGIDDIVCIVVPSFCDPPPTTPPPPPTTTPPPPPTTPPPPPTTPPPPPTTTTPPPTGKRPESPPKIVEKNTEALVILRDSKASQKERTEATKRLDELNGSLKDSQYLEFIREVKRYNPPAACIDKIESGTRVAGWPEGSLSGLADPSCSTAVAAGAVNSSSRWSALFVCVQRNPLATSTCVVHIPKD
ncbi:hypothetical protein QQY66_49335 [Streptomyces sp. DG2A-72]|uniref:hypothetical protein n=1 Tax=Streptomyces sp. DG2A-72 TaxID=3051386 RepID=UPI00265BF04D|nr:hypothetical protein [Streptomyces sp. DG2A-72]MDO0939317.1 hypothetical protein [Streptomyces sp. DG2A-72]